MGLRWIALPSTKRKYEGRKKFGGGEDDESSLTNDGF